MEVDNKVIWSTSKEHARYCNNLHNIVQFVLNKQWKIWRWMIGEAKKNLRKKNAIRVSKDEIRKENNLWKEKS